MHKVSDTFCIMGFMNLQSQKTLDWLHNSYNTFSNDNRLLLSMWYCASLPNSSFKI